MTDHAASSASKERPVIAYSFIKPLREAIAAHPSAPVVLDYTKTAKPWDVPPEARLLMCFHAGWEDAPATKPAGWPYGLEQINVLSAGVDKYPDWFFEDVPVTCGRGVSAEAIAEFALTAIFAQDKQIVALSNKGPDDPMPPVRGIAGKTVGLLGTGAIGAAIARRALAMDMRVVATSRSGRAPEGLSVEMLDSAADVLAVSDHAVIAMPLTEDTRGMVDGALLAAAKRGLHLVNVARGEQIVDADLLAALDSGQVGFATLDVTDPEPLPEDHPLRLHPRTLITPHISWMAEDNLDRLIAKTLRGYERFLAGESPEDVVDPKAGY